VDLRLNNEFLKRSCVQLLAAHPEFTVTDGRATMGPRLLLVEMDPERAEAVFAFVQSRTQASSEEVVVLLTASRDQHLVQQALASGAQGVLPVPLTRDEFDAALQRVKVSLRPPPQEAGTRHGHVLCLIGAAGGVGTSTVAANLAMCFQSLHPEKSVALVDLNLHGGDLPLFFGLEPSNSLRDLAADPSRLDQSYLMNLLAKHESGVQVLPSGYDGWMSGTPHPAEVKQVAALLQSLFDWVVVDCGHDLELASTTMLDLATTVLVVCTVRLQTMRRTRSLLEWLGQRGVIKSKVKLVVNRYRSEQAAYLKEATSILRCEPACLIPEDGAPADEALMGGIPLVAFSPQAEASRKIRGLTEALSGRRERLHKAPQGVALFQSMSRRWFAGVR
jgi:pilus assembly protein CpaE